MSHYSNDVPIFRSVRFLVGLMLMILLVTGASAQAAGCAGFPDVSTAHVYCNDIKYAQQSLWIDGYKDGTFQPDKLINRAEFLKVVVMPIKKMSLIDTGETCFSDVISSEWYSKYVCAAKDENIIQGDGLTNLFNPERSINEVEAIKIILKAMGFKKPEPPIGIGNWYDNYLKQATDIGLLINPTNKVTRGKAIYFLRAFFGNYSSMVENNPKNWKAFVCKAKNYSNLFKIIDPNCEQKWKMQIYWEDALRVFNAERETLHFLMKSEQDAHDVATDYLDAAEKYINLIGSADLLYKPDSTLKVTGPAEFIKQATSNILGGELCKGKVCLGDYMAEVMNAGLSKVQEHFMGKSLSSTVRAGNISFVAGQANKLLSAGFDVWSSLELEKLIKAHNGVQIANDYLFEYYSYGGSDAIIASSLGLKGNYNIYDIIYNYGVKKSGIKEGGFDYSKAASLAEYAKSYVNLRYKNCHEQGVCLDQMNRHLFEVE